MVKAETFGQALARGRKARGLTQRQLAANLNLSPQYLNDLERDRRDPPEWATSGALTAWIGVPNDYLCFLARRLPDDMCLSGVSVARVVEAFDAFRAVLSDGKGADK